MALTAAEKLQIKRALGLNSASAALYPWIDVYFAVNQVLETLPAETETEARSILARLTALETSLGTAANQRLKALEVGTITLRDDETDKLWSEVRRRRREMARLLGVPIPGAGGITVV